MSLLLRAVPDDSAEVLQSVNVKASIWGHWKRCICVWEKRCVGLEVLKWFQMVCCCGAFLEQLSCVSSLHPVLGEECQFKIGLGSYKGILFIGVFFSHTQYTSVNEATWEKCVRFCQYTHLIFSLWTSAVGSLMVTEHMVQLLHLELHDKCAALSTKMQIASSMCSGPTWEKTLYFFNLYEQGQV